MKDKVGATNYLGAFILKYLTHTDNPTYLRNSVKKIAQAHKFIKDVKNPNSLIHKRINMDRCN
jgi:hemoglobin-like flavoprotein